MDIRRKRDKIICLVHDQALETSLEKMTVARMFAVEINSISREEPPHQFR